MKNIARIENELHNAFENLDYIGFHETAFTDVDVYYAENRLYILRLDKNKSDTNMRSIFIKAESENAAIALALLGMHRQRRNKTLEEKLEYLKKAYEKFDESCQYGESNEYETGLLLDAVEDLVLRSKE